MQLLSLGAAGRRSGAERRGSGGSRPRSYAISDRTHARRVRVATDRRSRVTQFSLQLGPVGSFHARQLILILLWPRHAHGQTVTMCGAALAVAACGGDRDRLGALPKGRGASLLGASSWLVQTQLGFAPSQPLANMSCPGTRGRISRRGCRERNAAVAVAVVAAAAAVVAAGAAGGIRGGRVLGPQRTRHLEDLRNAGRQRCVASVRGRAFKVSRGIGGDSLVRGPLASAVLVQRLRKRAYDN